MLSNFGTKTFRTLFLLKILVALPSAVFARSSLPIIRVAILENLKFEKLSTDKYAKAYMDGLDVAASDAAEMGYRLEFKTFFYGKEPLAILEQIPPLKAWDPQVVIGPRSSSLFLMLKDQIDDRLVLSPFATANDVATMPSNFYSLTLPNQFFTQAILNLISEHLKGPAVVPVVELDCKNCQDFVNTFESLAQKQGFPSKPRASFLENSAESLDLTVLLKDYSSGDLILLPNSSYTSGTLIARIADHLKVKEPVFIGSDGWGDWSSSYVGKVKSQFAYIGYRVTPWSLDSTDQRTLTFLSKFRMLKSYEALGPASLLSYATVMASLKPLGRANKSMNPDNLKRDILTAFRSALQKKPNFERPTDYAIYKVTQQGEVFTGNISALKKEKRL